MKKLLLLILCFVGMAYVLHNSPDTKERKAVAPQKDTIVIVHRDTVFVEHADTVVLAGAEKGFSAPEENEFPSAVLHSLSRVVKVVATFQAYYLDTGNNLVPLFMTQTESGSGFIFKNNFVGVAGHCVRMKEMVSPDGTRFGYELISLTVRTSEGKLFPATLDSCDVRNDIAILSLGTHVHLDGLQTSAQSLKAYDPLWILGYPNGDNGVLPTRKEYFYDVQNGSTACPNGLMGEMIQEGHEKVMRISGGSATAPGMSGGPVVNENGVVVGLVVEIDYPTGNMSYAVPIEFFQRLVMK